MSGETGAHLSPLACSRCDVMGCPCWCHKRTGRWELHEIDVHDSAGQFYGTEERWFWIAPRRASRWRRLFRRVVRLGSRDTAEARS